ncbi:MAG TPA: fibronectin type III domain-containing protein [Chthoniobacterales bacterium]
MTFARVSPRAALFALLLTFIAPLHAALKVVPITIGNIFITTETVSIPVSGSGATVEWRVTDFFGREMDAGTNALAGGAQIRPAPGCIGWFLLDLTEKDASGGIISTLQTRFAIVTPIDVSTMGNSPFGVQTHFAQGAPTSLMQVMARAGIAHFRDEQYWDGVENPEGVFSFAKYTGYMNAAMASGIKPLITLDWGNHLYDWDTSGAISPIYTAPYSSRGRDGFANYALQVLNQFPGQIDYVEGWNEYNGGTFIKGQATANRGLYYSEMMKTVAQTIKPTHPSVTILGGATVPVAHGFLKSVFDNGGLAYLDALSVHCYRAYPEGVDLEISELDALVRNYNGGHPKPIWATEFSQNVTTTQGQFAATSYLPRIVTQMLAAKVQRMYYYLLQDWGSSFAYRGLVGKVDNTRGSLLPNPMFVAYAVLIRELYGWTCQARISSGLANTTYVYRFGSGSAEKYVCWSTAPTTVFFSTTAGVNVTDIMGNVRTVNPIGGIVGVELDENIVYLSTSGDVQAVTEADNAVVADSLADYTKVQGANGWYYGSVSVPSGGSYNPSAFSQLNWAIWRQDNYRWRGYYDLPFITRDGIHPDGGWAVRRWVSDVAGVVELTGHIATINTVDGVRARIMVDGVEKYNRLLTANQSVTYTVSGVNVVPGSKVDFTVDRNADTTNDSAEYTARITMVAAVAAPSGLTASGIADNRIRLDWIDNSPDEDGFEIQWKWGTQAFVTAATIPANTVSCVHAANMASGRLYTYRVRAFRGTEYSEWSPVASATDGY